MNECSAYGPITNPLQEPALPALLSSILHLLELSIFLPLWEHMTGTLSCLSVSRSLLSALTVCCLNGPPQENRLREKESTKARVLKCQEDMPFNRKFQRRKHQPHREGLLPRCFHLISPFAAASEAAGLESEQTKQALEGISQIERKLHLIKMCAPLQTIEYASSGLQIPTPPGNLFSSYSTAIGNYT